MELTGKTVVVTGASRGLGAGMAEWFRDQGAGVGVCARQQPGLHGEGVVSETVDVTDQKAVESFAARVGAELGPIDLWVNNAAVLEPIVPVRDLTWDDLSAHLHINLGGVLHGTRAYLAHLASAGHRGALVNITTGAARRGLAGAAAYSAGKAGVDRLTETVALEEPDLFRLVLAVAPGVIETDMQRTLRAQDETVLHDLEMFRRYHEDDMMSTPAWVAERIAGWVFGKVDPGGVLVRVPPPPHHPERR